MNATQTVLLIEDEPAHAELIEHAFSASSLDVKLLAAANLKEAREQLGSLLPDAVITDLRLRDGLGTELLDEGKDPGFALIVITSQGDEKAAVAALKAGALDYVVKSPATLAELPNVTRRAIQEWQTRRELEDHRVNLELKVKERTLELREGLRRERELRGDLQKALEKERELGVLKARLVSMVSHEFRTPMSIILSTADILTAYADRMDHEKRLGHLQSITRNIHHMSEILEDTLRVGAFDAGGIKADFQEVDVEDYCHNLLADFMKPDEPSRIKLQFLRGPGSNGILWLDIRQLNHVFTNLLSNALKYSPPETTVDFEVNTSVSELTVAVRDRGIGIPAEDLKQILEPFERAGNAADVSGTGLGLAIVKRALDLLGGEIQIDSTLDRGTTVSVRIPGATPQTGAD